MGKQKVNRNWRKNNNKNENKTKISSYEQDLKNSKSNSAKHTIQGTKK